MNGHITVLILLCFAGLILALLAELRRWIKSKWRGR